MKEMEIKIENGVFKIEDTEFIVLKNEDGRVIALTKKFIADCTRFGENNDYRVSKVKEICDKFSKRIKSIVGEDKLHEFSLDLVSRDGLDTYGKIKCYSAPLTSEMYRKYVRIIDQFKVSNWWWLSTPDTTPEHNNNWWVECVSPSGNINDDVYDNDFGVRPFCIFDSSIFVS